MIEQCTLHAWSGFTAGLSLGFCLGVLMMILVSKLEISSAKDLIRAWYRDLSPNKENFSRYIDLIAKSYPEKFK